MDHQTEPGEKLAASPERIWLAPACNVDERSWCEDDIGCCDECGEPTIEYRRADLIEAELARLRAEVEMVRAALQIARRHVWATAEAEHMMDGFGPRQQRASDSDLAAVDAALTPTVER